MWPVLVNDFKNVAFQMFDHFFGVIGIVAGFFLYLDYIILRNNTYVNDESVNIRITFSASFTSGIDMLKIRKGEMQNRNRVA